MFESMYQFDIHMIAKTYKYFLQKTELPVHHREARCNASKFACPPIRALLCSLLTVFEPSVKIQ